ncbi:hypothetical protein D9M71_702460 [compost metagenome]
MDVGAPSNFERLRWLYEEDDDALRAAFRVEAVDDAAIRELIARRHAAAGEVFCPHTATAVKVLEQLRAETCGMTGIGKQILQQGRNTGKRAGSRHGAGAFARPFEIGRCQHVEMWVQPLDAVDGCLDQFESGDGAAAERGHLPENVAISIQRLCRVDPVSAEKYLSCRQKDS